PRLALAQSRHLILTANSARGANYHSRLIQCRRFSSTSSDTTWARRKEGKRRRLTSDSSTESTHAVRRSSSVSPTATPSISPGYRHITPPSSPPKPQPHPDAGFPHDFRRFRLPATRKENQDLTHIPQIPPVAARLFLRRARHRRLHPLELNTHTPPSSRCPLRTRYPAPSCSPTRPETKAHTYQHTNRSPRPTRHRPSPFSLRAPKLPSSQGPPSTIYQDGRSALCTTTSTPIGMATTRLESKYEIHRGCASTRARVMRSRRLTSES
ncbi:hypothetical protein R3P38DRAFT_3605992, partial [Favolaschia claudopus]